MSIGALDAAAAYGRILDVGDKTPDARPAGGASPAGGGFGGMVERIVGEATSSLRVAETASARQVAGKGDLVDVATAIGAAEVALETVVAVRDRMVAAYSEIMRMQI